MIQRLDVLEVRYTKGRYEYPRSVHENLNLRKLEREHVSYAKKIIRQVITVLSREYIKGARAFNASMLSRNIKSLKITYVVTLEISNKNEADYYTAIFGGGCRGNKSKPIPRDQLLQVLIGLCISGIYLFRANDLMQFTTTC